MGRREREGTGATLGRKLAPSGQTRPKILRSFELESSFSIVSRFCRHGSCDLRPTLLSVCARPTVLRLVSCLQQWANPQVAVLLQTTTPNIVISDETSRLRLGVKKFRSKSSRLWWCFQLLVEKLVSDWYLDEMRCYWHSIYKLTQVCENWRMLFFTCAVSMEKFIFAAAISEILVCPTNHPFATFPKWKVLLSFLFSEQDWTCKKIVPAVRKAWYSCLARLRVTSPARSEKFN